MLRRGADLVPGVRKSIENEEIPKGAARVLNAAKIQQEFAEKKRKQRDEADGAGPSRKKQKGGQDEGANALRIKPGESIGHFNRCVYRCLFSDAIGLKRERRRVEDSLRHTVKEAMQSSSAKMRRTQKEEKEELAQKKAEKKAAVASSKAAKLTKTSDGSDDEEEPPSKQKQKTKTEDKSERAVPLHRQETKHDGKAKEFERVSSSAPKRLNDIVQAPPQIKQLPRKAKKLAAAGGTAKTGVSLKDGVLSMAQKAMMEEERDRVIRLYREMKRRKGST